MLMLSMMFFLHQCMVQCAQHVSVLMTPLREYINSHADTQHELFSHQCMVQCAQYVNPLMTPLQEYTNYHFDVKPNALHGALDRFAQFFIDPLCKADALEREVMAVDNEFSGTVLFSYCNFI